MAYEYAYHSVAGSQDLWVSTQNSTSEKWSTPINLGPDINTAAVEWRAALTWDGMNIVFNSTRDGTYDFFKSQRIKITGKNK